ncbi:MAG: glucose-6-phosphate isomerase [Phenylobacterium sp.]|jgi:glucose-6-phosphate isomerase
MDKCNAWLALKNHKKTIEKQHLKSVFATDPARFDKYSLVAGGITLDYSKNRINSQTMSLLGDLAREMNLAAKIEAMFKGNKINATEGRAVLHTALRQQSDEPLMVDGDNIIVQVKQTLDKMEQFCVDIESGERTGYQGHKFTDILCLGIGGSFLGPKIAVEALKQYQNKAHKVHFVANVDGYHLHDVLSSLNIETTLVVIASKSFSTEETMLNAKTTRQWLLSGGLTAEQLNQHMVAISSNVASAMEFGVDADNIFPMWDWVGGRYSLWSAIGLPIALAVGFEHFRQLLAGANDMDEHFANTPFSDNMPVTLALLGMWNINFWGATSHCIIPYCHYLRGLPAHIQQLDMESNGKSVSVNGEPLNYLTGPAIWGSEGVNSQHAFFQQIHQSNSLYPVDFILPLNVNHPYEEHHDMLVSHCFAQSQALMEGKTISQAYDELASSGLSEQHCHELAPHKRMEGNKPNNVLLMQDLSARNIGALLALYEHKVAVQGMLWNINSFDQWGVELGKQLSKPIHQSVEQGHPDDTMDCSTRALIAKYIEQKI